MNTTSTICLTFLGALAIAGVVICGLAGVTATASALTGIAIACASGVIGYTFGVKDQKIINGSPAESTPATVDKDVL